MVRHLTVLLVLLLYCPTLHCSRHHSTTPNSAKLHRITNHSAKSYFCIYIFFYVPVPLFDIPDSATSHKALFHSAIPHIFSPYKATTHAMHIRFLSPDNARLHRTTQVTMSYFVKLHLNIKFYTPLPPPHSTMLQFTVLNFISCISQLYTPLYYLKRLILIMLHHTILCTLMLYLSMLHIATLHLTA